MSLSRSVLCFCQRFARPARRSTGQLPRLQAARWLRIETLEPRALLVAEAEPFDLNRVFDVTGFAGTPTAIVNWGDGSQSPATLAGGTNPGNVQIRFDYSLDTTGFLSAANRRSVLDAAAAIVTSRLTDTLSAIQPSGTNTWTASTFHPATGAVVNFNNLNIAANEVVVYVGARQLGTSQLGSGGPGGISARGTSDWLNTVSARDQAGALATPKTDFGPWGGSLAFDVDTNWYFGMDETGLLNSQQDFITVAVHELSHLLGFGTAPSWTTFVAGGSFIGPKAVAAYDAGGVVPLSTDLGHFLETVTDSGRKVLMGPVIEAGKRDLLTSLDLAALDDIGWTVTDNRVTISARHVYADNGSYPISITYRGSTVGSLIDTTTATITNTTPVLTVPGNQTAIRDQALRLTDIGTLSDPGFGTETFTYSIEWGDTAVDSGPATIDRAGSAAAPTLASFDGSHIYTSAGIFTVTVRGRDDDGGEASGSFQVVVSPPPQLTLELNLTSIAENAGAAAATLTVRRSAPASITATIVDLVSSDASEATVPMSVTIPAGELSATVPVTAVDDTLLDGTQTVTLTASGLGLGSGTAMLSVTDAETLTASFTAATIAENAAINSFFLTVRRSNTDITQPLTISIAGNQPAQIAVPSSAEIAAGSQEVVIPIQPINDSAPELALMLTYQITATGYVGVDRNLVLSDDEPPLFQNQIDRFDVDRSGEVFPLDALRVINALSRRRQDNSLDPASDTFNNLLPDVNGDYLLTPLDALLIINQLTRLARAQSVAAGEDTAASVGAAPMEQRHASLHDVAMLDWADDRLF